MKRAGCKRQAIFCFLRLSFSLTLKICQGQPDSLEYNRSTIFVHAGNRCLPPNYPSPAPCEFNANIDPTRSTTLVMNRVLRVINERLQGRYNLAVPRPAGLGAADAGNDLPLSVQGQVTLTL